MTSGKVQTVLGLIDPEKLGRTLTHEHISMDLRAGLIKPPRESDLENINCSKITLRDLSWIRQNPMCHQYSLALNEEPIEDMIQEVAEFKKEGGSSIVDNTVYGMQRNVEVLKKISSASGLNIIAGSSYYIDCYIPPEMKSLTVEDMVTTIVGELTVGVENTSIKCGIIGEVGCSWPLTPFEKKSLEAAAIAQTDTGAPVIIHPGRDNYAPIEIVRIFQEAGGDVDKMVMSHLDRTVFDHNVLLELAATGCYLEYDLFGVEFVDYSLNQAVDMPSDSQRIQEIKFLISEGYEDQLMMSHDIYACHHLLKYGGHGYAHIQVNIVPKMLKRGISQGVIDKIQIENPKKWLTFK